MSLSKRLRYEILKRDDHTCRYCGAKAPNVELAVDHVLPVALGGTDEPHNLVTACVDCNAGKSSSAATDGTVADVAGDAERWAKAVDTAAQEASGKRDRAFIYIGSFAEVWPDYYRLPGDWEASVAKFYALGLPESVMVDAAYIALGNTNVAGGASKFRYFAGVCWTRLREIQDRAAAIIAAEKGTE